MFTEESLLLTLQYIAYIFILPPVIILVIDRLVQLLAKDAFSFYSTTGIVGTPIHELSHAAACVLFGMRIIKMGLYAPNRATGTLGYVSFAYNPNSTLHAIGLVVQGIAPLLMGYLIFIVVIPWGHAPVSVLHALELTDHSPTYKQALAGASALIMGNLVDGPRGFIWCLLALIIGMHAIPSWADIRIAAKGMFTLLALAIGLSALSQIDLSFLPPGIRDALYVILGLMLKGFFWVLEQLTYAVTMVTVVAVLGITVFLLLPCLVIKLIRMIRGTQPELLSAPAPAAGAMGGVDAATDQQTALLNAVGVILAASSNQNPALGPKAPSQTTAVRSTNDHNVVIQ
jgi:hypothetical protein